MDEPKLETRVRLAETEPREFWAVDYRSSPLETWSTFPQRFRDEESARQKADELEGKRQNG